MKQKFGMLVPASYALVALMIGASCSSEVANDEVFDETANEPASGGLLEPSGPTLESVRAEWRKALEGSLSEYERRTILTTLTAQGIPEEVIDFRGRMVSRGEDAFWYADDLLANRALEKGLVFRNPDNSSAVICRPDPEFPQYGCTPGALRPDDYANASGANLLWLRPSTGNYYVVVSNHFPSNFTGANGVVTKAVNLIQNSVAGGSGDCLNHPVATFIVNSEAQWNAQSATLRANSRTIFIIPSEGACFACGMFPRFVMLQGDMKMQFGPLIALSDGFSHTANSYAYIIHELLHNMGFAHSDEDPATTFSVPGTPPVCTSSGSNQCGVDNDILTNGSVMRSGSATDPGFDNWQINSTPGAARIPPGDVNMIKKLYGPGTSCEYQSTFRTVTPCGPNGILNATGTHCCLGPCAKCGGSGCSAAPGNETRCCTGHITNACGPFDAPCVVR